MTRDNQLVYLDQKKALVFNRGLPGLKLPDTNGRNTRASSAEGYTFQKLPTSVDEARRLSDRTVLTEKRLARYRAERAAQRAAAAGLNDEIAPDQNPAPRKRKRVVKAVPKAEAAVNATENLPPDVSERAAASIDGSARDYSAEKRLLNALAKLIKVPLIKRVGGLAEKRGPQVGGKYVSTREVQVNDNLHGSERMSVLLHEFGHHVVVSKVAKALGLDPDVVTRMGSDELLSAFDKVRPDVAAEYRAWREANGGERVPVSRSLQAACGDVLAHLPGEHLPQPRAAAQGIQAHHGVVDHQPAVHLSLEIAAVAGELPRLDAPVAAPPADAVVPGQRIRRGRHAAPGKVRRDGHWGRCTGPSGKATMSRCRHSPGWMPASNCPSTMSASRRSAYSSTVTSG